MGKGFEYQLTNKAKTFITFLQLLHSDTDCVLHLYKVLKDVEEEENKNYHFFRLVNILFLGCYIPNYNSLNSFPLNYTTRGIIKPTKHTQIWWDNLNMIKMIGGSSKYCDAPYYRFILNLKQMMWINGNLLTESMCDPIIVEQPPPPSLNDKVKTLTPMWGEDGKRYRLGLTFKNYTSRRNNSIRNQNSCHYHHTCQLVVEFEANTANWLKNV